MSIDGSTPNNNNTGCLDLILGKSRLVKQYCNQVLGAAVGKGDLFIPTPFFLETAVGEPCASGNHSQLRDLCQTTFPQKRMCFCCIILVQLEMDMESHESHMFHQM